MSVAILVMAATATVVPAGIALAGTPISSASIAPLALNAPVVGMAATPTGKGAWRVASDGGIFTSGDAHFYGSTGGMHLNQPIVGMATTRSGKGYWLVAADGGIFCFGDAKFHGSGGSKFFGVVIDMAPGSNGRGYWLLNSVGQVPTQHWSVSIYDRLVVPSLRRIEAGRSPRFGQSLFCVGIVKK